MLLCIAIEQRYAGHATQVGHVASQCHVGAYTARHVVVVEDDIDVSDLEEVTCNRVQGRLEKFNLVGVLQTIRRLRSAGSRNRREKVVKRSLYVTLAVLILITALGCEGEPKKTAGIPSSTQAMTAMATPAQPRAAHSASEPYTGTVIEFINASTYTYVQVDTGDKKIWAAAPAFHVKVGDKVTISTGAPMRNYHSKTLDRTFDVVYFVGSITPVGSGRASSQFPAGHPKVTRHGSGGSTAAKMDFSSIVKPEGGKTIAELYKGKEDLSGKKVTIRGKVVKFNSGIMGKNWIHLRDGTGVEGTNDLTVTTSGRANIGDTVLATGVMATDKDYGAGYKYPVILEDAEIAVE